MLQIHHEDVDAVAPSKAYADACWRADPRLSPDWWRELLGHTTGKLALDMRQHLTNLPHLQTGCNLVLASPQTWLPLQPHLTPAHVSVLVTENPAAPQTHYPTWLVSNQNLIQMETLVKEGHIEAYGIVLDETPLHTWLEEAAEAAQTVYGRKKRPALKVVVASMDILNLTLLTQLTTRHKEEAVSALELAARLGFAVIITPATLPSEAEPSEAALDALIQAATAEQNLNTHLAGWPMAQGVPLFNLLTTLAQGQAPWPTPLHFHNWQNHLWPQLQIQWQELENPSSRPLIHTYLQALQTLQSYGEELAATAAQPLLTHLLAIYQPRFPKIWQSQPELEQTLALLSSIPAIGAVAIAHPFQPQPLQHLGDIPDVASILLHPVI